jgi:hypothetical protein
MSLSEEMLVTCSLDLPGEEFAEFSPSPKSTLYFSSALEASSSGSGVTIGGNFFFFSLASGFDFA